VKHFPNALIKQPERVFIGVLAVMLGVGSLLRLTPTIDKAFSEWIALEWGLTLILGGATKLSGLAIGNHNRADMTQEHEEMGRSLERVGSLLVMIGSFTYVGAVLSAVGIAGFVSIVTYTLLGVTSAIRLLSSSAGRSLLNHSEDI
jgi:hypothetical protein